MTAWPYVALGDSISIDDYAGGPGRGGPSLLFRNRADDFPDWQGHDLLSRDPNTTFTRLASDGATTRTLLDVQLPHLAALGIRPALVTLTIGGNDLLQAYGDTAAAREVIRRVRTAVSDGLNRVSSLLAPNGRVAVGTVYDPSDGTGDALRLGLPPWPDAVALIGELNDALRQTSTENGAAVAEIAMHFHGHGLFAGDPTQAQARPPSRSLWFSHVIEPNAWGASGVRAAFHAALTP